MINYDEIDAARDDVSWACEAYPEVRRLVAVVDQMEDEIGRLSLTPSEVEALRWLRKLASPSPMFDHCRYDSCVAEYVEGCERATAILDRLLAASEPKP